MTWQVRSSNKMLILGIVFIIIFFVIMLLFPNFMSLSPNMVGIWLYTLLMVFALELGFFSIFVVKIKQAIAAFLVIFLWSLGFLVLPTPPEGYGEAEYGGWAILLMIIVVFYAKRQKSKKKEKQSAS